MFRLLVGVASAGMLALVVVGSGGTYPPIGTAPDGGTRDGGVEPTAASCEADGVDAR